MFRVLHSEISANTLHPLLSPVYHLAKRNREHWFLPFFSLSVLNYGQIQKLLLFFHIHEELKPESSESESVSAPAVANPNKS